MKLIESYNEDVLQPVDITFGVSVINTKMMGKNVSFR